MYSCKKKKKITEPESDQTSLDPNKQRLGNKMQGPKRSMFRQRHRGVPSQAQSMGDNSVSDTISSVDKALHCPLLVEVD